MKKVLVPVMLLLVLWVTTPVMAENPAISEVKRFGNVCSFHLLTGQYPNGVWVGGWYGEPVYYEEEGFLGLTYRNLSPDLQVIRLTTSLGANHAFLGYPKQYSFEAPLAGDTETSWIIMGVPPDEVEVMADLWFIGWGAGQQIEVTLELLDISSYPWQSMETLYQGTMTIMPLGL